MVILSTPEGFIECPFIRDEYEHLFVEYLKNCYHVYDSILFEPIDDYSRSVVYDIIRTHYSIWEPKQKQWIDDIVSMFQI